MKNFILGLLLALPITSIFAVEAVFPNKVEVFQKAISSQVALTGVTYGGHEILGKSLSEDLAEHPNSGKGVSFHSICEKPYAEINGEVQSSCQLEIERVWRRGNITLTIYNLILKKVGNEDVIVAASRDEENI